MNTRELENETSTIYLLGEDEKKAIRQSADLLGKHLGEVAAGLISEFLLAIMSAKFPVAQPSQKSIVVAQTPQNPILKASEVADILRISKAKGYRMIQQGEIPSIRFGRTTRVRQQDLDEFIKRQHQG